MPKNFKYLVLAILVALLGFSYGYLNTLFTSKKPDPYTPVQFDQGEEASKSTSITTRPETLIRYITSYSNCDHMTKSEETIDPSLVGLTKSEYISLVEDWEITGFTPKEIVLERQKPGVCEDHYYIGIHEGYVTLFQGAPGFNSVVVEQTEIIAGKLRSEDRQLLERGLIIVDKDEYLRIREGLAH